MRILFIILSFLFFNMSFAQTSLKFCASVNNDGGCNLQNTKFFSSPDSLIQKISLLAFNLNGFGTDSLIFQLNSIDKEGVEKNYALHGQAVAPNWVYAWKPVYFDSPGRYSVRIINRNGQLQAIGTFELFLP